MERQNVRNAASNRQVKAAERRERLKREQELADLTLVLGTQPGRRVFWRILQHCKVFSSIWSQSAQIHYDAGRQDVGHFVMSEIADADPEAIFTMMREAKIAADKEALVINAEADEKTDEGEKTDG